MENHVSPDGKYLLSCTNGLSVYSFERNPESKDIRLKHCKWQLPIETKDIPMIELATRVKFEASDIVRILTLDNRDILYRFDEDQPEARYLTEVRMENQFHPDLSLEHWTDITHKFTSKKFDNVFKHLMHRNSIFRSHYWYKKLLLEEHKDLINSNSQTKFSQINFISPA